MNVKGPYRVEVIADGSGKYAGNALTFPTLEEAKAYARDLMRRWTLVRSWRVLFDRDDNCFVSAYGDWKTEVTYTDDAPISEVVNE